ncbi:MAG: LacI family transcriptional regulator, partial [Clostridiaceae bacterium]|nr:LacI family transcriptional regulator [Clostridiaceae bacterium]
MDNKAINIGVITSYTENFYFGTLLKGIQNAIKQEKGRLYIFNTYMMDRFRMYAKGDKDYYSFSFNHIDAWIIISIGVLDEYISMVHNSGKPAVQIGHKKSPNNCAMVLDDSYNNAKQAVEHLLHHGHKRIAYMGCSNHPDMIERHAGYKDLLDAHGLYDESIVFDVESPMPECAKAAVSDMLDKGINFTAVFTANDFLAIGLIE